MTVFTFTVEGRFATFKSLNILNRFGRADCGMEKLFLEFPAVGDLGEKQQNLVGEKVQSLNASDLCILRFALLHLGAEGLRRQIPPVVFTGRRPLCRIFQFI